MQLAAGKLGLEQLAAVAGSRLVPGRDRIAVTLGERRASGLQALDRPVDLGRQRISVR